MQHEQRRAACHKTCSQETLHGHPARTCTTSAHTHHEHSGSTRSTDHQHEHATLTGSMDQQHGWAARHAARARCTDTLHGQPVQTNCTDTLEGHGVITRRRKYVHTLQDTWRSFKISKTIGISALFRYVPFVAIIYVSRRRRTSKTKLSLQSERISIPFCFVSLPPKMNGALFRMECLLFIKMFL
jgi:hypothetical protein